MLDDLTASTRGLPLLGLLCAVGIVGCYLLARAAQIVLDRRDHHRRLRNGTADLDDLARYLSARSERLPETGVARDHLTRNPALAVHWLRAGHDWGLLLACYDAGLSETEVAGHLNGTTPVTIGQVGLLRALQPDRR